MSSTLPSSPELLELLPDTVCVVDADGRLLFANGAFERVLGYPRAEVLGRRLFELVHPDDRAATMQQARRLMDGTGERHFRNRYLHRDGHAVDLLWSAQWLPDYRVRVGVAREVSELRRVEQELEYRANHDPLTGLANRRRLREALESALIDAARAETPVAVLYVDLDGFKQINDEYGHDAGDAVLVEVSRRLQHGLRQGDLIARLGGDEFVALLRGCDPASARGLAEVLQVRMQAPFARGDQPMAIAASIGIACFPSDATQAGALLACADRRMYAAKRAGTGVATF